MHTDCCNSNNWVVLIIIVVIILIILFIINKRNTKTEKPEPIPKTDWVHAYNDINSDIIVPHEPIEFNNQIFALNSQIEFNESTSSFILQPGQYQFYWSVNIIDTLGYSGPVAFGISTDIEPPNKVAYSVPSFLDGSISEQLLPADSNNNHRSSAMHIVTLTEKTEIQLAEAIGTNGLKIGTGSVDGINHQKQNLSIVRLDKPCKKV